MGRINQKCQVPTPHNIVTQMLDQVGYTHNLYGKRILENSCGSGGFLTEIVERYIKDCISQQLTEDQIIHGLQRDIHGFEKDRRLHKECIKKLDAISQKYGLNNIHWNIKRRNALHACKTGRYQFVVGNPPYLAYPELDNTTREYLRANFDSCKKGKPDYYYAFIELSLNALASDGKLIYLVPGNFMKNLYSEELRQIILPSLCEIVDFSHQRLFDDVLTSSVIIFCDRTRTTEIVRYEDRHYGRVLNMKKSKMKGKWLFNTDSSHDNLLPFSECFHASAPVATQLNEAFVINNWNKENALTLQIGSFDIEQAVLRNAAAPKALQKELQEKIIFPYSYSEDGILQHYTEEQFQACFPGAYRYLFERKKKLENRKADKKALWFEYGRSQFLTHINQQKLILSSFITNHPRIYILDNNTVPYAGICIVAKPGYTVEQAQTILNSTEFMNYVRKVGVCTSGVSYRISPTDINSFLFPRNLLGG